jgi:ABC-2 type transport system ATP-binding protein
MVVLKACSQRLVEGVRDLPFVQEVEVKDRCLLVSVERPEEDNPALVRRLVELGGEVVYVREHRPSLEEIYFRVVGSRES